MGKEMEGDNEQRRRRAGQARKEGEQPSTAGVTTGASNQRRHLGGDAGHDERIAGSGWGKQQPDRVSADPRPGSLSEPGPGGSSLAPSPLAATADAATDREPGDLGDEDARVLETVARLEVRGGAASLDQIVDEVDLPRQQTETTLRRLRDHHDVIQEMPEDDQTVATERRFRVKTRL